MIWALLACADPGLPPGGGQPDVLLISVDTLRADHVGAYGHDRPTTPNLDALAARGTRFAHARSPAPWTLPAHTTMLTGLLPLQHGVTDDHLQLSADTPVLAERLAAVGYATGGFVASLFVGPRFGLNRGFEVFEDFDLRTGRDNLTRSPTAEQVVDAALGFVRGRPGEPVFLFVHLYDAHYPYEAPSPWDTAFDRPGQAGDARYVSYEAHQGRPLPPEQLAHQLAQYDEEIRYADAQIGRLLDAFAAAGRAPLVVVTADHGEEFFERGSWGHAHTLYPEQLRVPLILAGPGVPAGEVQEAVVGLQDIAPTLATLVGAEPPTPGASLLNPPASRAFPSDTARFDTNLLGLWAEGWRLDWDLSTHQAALYQDPQESVDLAGQHPERLATLQAQVLALLGTPWEAAPGALLAEGALFAEGRLLGSQLSTAGPLPFAVLPADAPLRHSAGVEARAAGGEPPPTQGPLRYHGPARAGSVTLGEAERRQLEALGYLQE